MMQFMSGTRIVAGEGALDTLPAEVQQFGDKVLVVTDSGVGATGLLDLVVSPLKKAGIEVVVYDSVKGNPTEVHVEESLDLYRKANASVIIGVGGGSPLDTSKAVSLLATNGGRVADFEGATRYEVAPAPLIAVPTTTGTGSEVTKGAVISNVETGAKMVIASTQLYPRVALLDPRSVAALPGTICVATGMDALTHAIEGFVANGASPMSDALCLHATRLIAESFRPAAAGRPDALYRMLVASCVAGCGFHNAGLGLVHALANTAQNHFPLHHGTTCGVLLPHVMDYNVIAAPGKFAQLAQALGADIDGLPDYEAARHSVSAVTQLMQDIGAANTLSSLGVSADKFGELAEEATGNFDWAPNPRRATIGDAKILYAAAL